MSGMPLPISLLLTLGLGLQTIAGTYVFQDKQALLAARDAWCANSDTASSTYGAIAEWDVSALTDLSWLFCAMDCVNDFGGASWCAQCNPDCANFNDNINTWDVSNVVDLVGTFHDARAFNQPLNGWDTANVDDMHGTFRAASAFDQSLSSWNVAAVTVFTSIFIGTSSLSTCNKALIHNTFSVNAKWACTSDPGCGNMGSWASYGCPPFAPTPPPPSSPISGAVIELTGDAPEITFGDPGAPTCKLTLNRAHSRLDSSCGITTSHANGNRRALDGGVDLQIQVDALKAELAEIQTVVADMLAKKKKLNGTKVQTQPALA